MPILDSVRDWLSFTHPSWLIDDDEPDEGHVVVFADATFLLSNWRCRYGEPGGCDRLLAGTAALTGCCGIGAILDDDDVQRVQPYYEQLTDADWDPALRAHVEKVGGWHRFRSKDERNTRVHKGGCVFSNRDPQRPGCAFHHLAQRLGVSHVETKPMACWMQPMLVEQDEEGRLWLFPTSMEDWNIEDEDALARVWVTRDPGNYVGEEPVYLSLERELRELVGDDGYAILKRLCEQRLAALPVGLPVFNGAALDRTPIPR